MTEETMNTEAEMPEAEAGAEAGIPESINLSDLGTLLQSSKIVKTFRGTTARQPYRKGFARGVDRISDGGFAVDEIETRKVAKGAWSSRAARTSWWVLRCAARRLAPWPTTPSKLKLAAALLRRGGHRSAPGCVYNLKRANTTRIFGWSDVFALELRDCVRATTRGLGPPIQAEPFDMDLLKKYADSNVEVVARRGFPARPADTALVASWWMLREAELGAAVVDQISFADVVGTPCGDAELNLPISKNDVEAKGKKRCLRCSCPHAGCPVAAVRRLVGHSSGFGRTSSDAPLVTDFEGNACAKRHITESFRKGAEQMGQVNAHSISGHSGRTSGAQMFAAANNCPLFAVTFARHFHASHGANHPAHDRACSGVVTRLAIGRALWRDAAHKNQQCGSDKYRR